MAWTCPSKLAMLPMRNGFSMQAKGLSRKRGRLKWTWMEVIRMDLKRGNLAKDLAQDRPEWRNIIQVANPK